MTVINYESLIDKAMHNIVKSSLLKIQNNTIPGDHHFYISFLTHHAKVKISPRLKQQYKDEMTIVLQHQFEDFEVFEEYFCVTLSFGGINEQFKILFDALTAFADPSVKFGLQFKHAKEEQDIVTEDETPSTRPDNVVSFADRRKKQG